MVEVNKQSQVDFLPAWVRRLWCDCLSHVSIVLLASSHIVTAGRTTHRSQDTMDRRWYGHGAYFQGNWRCGTQFPDVLRKVAQDTRKVWIPLLWYQFIPIQHTNLRCFSRMRPVQRQELGSRPIQGMGLLITWPWLPRQKVDGVMDVLSGTHCPGLYSVWQCIQSELCAQIEFRVANGSRFSLKEVVNFL